MTDASRAVTAARLRRLDPDEVLARIDRAIEATPRGTVVPMDRADVQLLVDALRASRREAQAVWRCSISDFVGCLDVLRNRWTASRRRPEREAGARLGAVLDVVYEGRNPAPHDHTSATKAGLELIGRVRALLSDVPTKDATRTERAATTGDTGKAA